MHVVAPVAMAVALLGPRPASAQDQIPGVSLGLVYTGSYVPALAIQPFTGRFGGSGLAPEVESIISTDLRNSDRFEMLSDLPAGFVRDQVDYALWDRLGAVWLVTGTLEGAGEGYVLLLELHDVAVHPGAYEALTEQAFEQVGELAFSVHHDGCQQQ